MFLAGFFTVAQFSFWGNYLPRVYPTASAGNRREFRGEHRRAAHRHVVRLGDGHAGHHTRPRLRAHQGGACGGGRRLLVYLVGFVASFWLPEPTKENLPD